MKYLFEWCLWVGLPWIQDPKAFLEIFAKTQTYDLNY